MDLEQFILNAVDGISTMNFSSVIFLVQILFVFFWLIVLGWVWVDAGERTTSRFSRFISVLLVLFLNVFGLIIYLIVRPKHTIQELYWSDLERRYLKYETSELGDCPKCGFSLQPGFNVCPKCKFSLKVKCSRCEVWVDREYDFCPYCANELDGKRMANETDTVEEMEGEVNKSRDEAIKAVEGNKTKYVDRHGIFRKVKDDFLAYSQRMKEKRASKPKKVKRVVKKKAVKKNKKKTNKKK